jgi:hypothetical protein
VLFSYRVILYRTNTFQGKMGIQGKIMEGKGREGKRERESICDRSGL